MSYANYQEVKDQILDGFDYVKGEILSEMTNDELRTLAKTIHMQNHPELVSPYQLVINHLNERMGGA